MVVGTSEGKCTMIEGEAKCIKDTHFLQCVRVGLGVLCRDSAED